MILLTNKVEADIKRLDRFRKTGFRKIVKERMGDTLLHWHGEFAEHHFSDSQTTRYRAFQRLNWARSRKPHLVETGTLRDRVLRQRGKEAVKGTSRKMRLEMKYGRPPGYSEGEMKAKAHAIKPEHLVDWRTAMRRAYYGVPNYGDWMRDKDKFKELMTQVNGPEVVSMRNHLRRGIIEALNERGTKKRVS